MKKTVSIVLIVLLFLCGCSRQVLSEEMIIDKEGNEQWCSVYITVSDVLSLFAILISLAVFIRDIQRNRFHFKISGPNEYEELYASYYFPLTDLPHGSRCSFITELLIENHSASPLCITTVKIKANRYHFEISASFSKTKTSTIYLDAFEGTRIVNTDSITTLPLMLKPYEAKVIKLWFPSASDNYMPEEADTVPSNEYTVPYTLVFYTQRGKKQYSGSANVGVEIDKDHEPAFGENLG